MIRFLLKGLIRDRSRSLFPVIIVATGVFITVVGYGWIKGIMSDFVDTNARFYTGHLRVMTRAYAAEEDQIPNDLALIRMDTLLADLSEKFPGMKWTPRIKFGGLLDIPDDLGETRTQTTVTGLAVDLFSEDSTEIKMLNLNRALVRGKLPGSPFEILISDELAQKLEVHPGESATLIGSTMWGSMAIYNFTIVGTVNFGVAVMDRGAMIADIKGIQLALDMENAAGEILGYFADQQYDNQRAQEVCLQFNEQHQNGNNEFLPKMLTLRQQNELETMFRYTDSMGSVMVFIFVFIMSIVLWNSGLLGSLRRYGEIGVRLAIGEAKGHIYRAMISEAALIGFAGSLMGTLLGVIATLYLQIVGIDISASLKNYTAIMQNVMRAQLTLISFFIGFIPGFTATILGTMMSGIGIYKRQTAQLFKELEV